MINIKYFYLKKDDEGYNHLYCDLSVVRNNDRSNEVIQSIRIVDAEGETIYYDTGTPIVSGYCGKNGDKPFKITVTTSIDSTSSPLSQSAEQAIGRNSILYDYTTKTETGYTYEITTMDMYPVYKTFMNFVDEICESGCCDPCESQCPNRFVDFLIRLKAFELASFTGDDNLGYLYNLIASKKPKNAFKRGCGGIDHDMPRIKFPTRSKPSSNTTQKKNKCGCKDV